MAFENPSPMTESTLELRLATTMTGGVSLAIWMAVVAREINLLAQASQWRRARGTFSTHSRRTKESADSLKLDAELIDLLDMVVDVDILSGTSAGGINAVLRHDDAHAWAQRRNVSVNKAADGIEIRDEEAINSTLPELTRAAKNAKHLLFERLSDTGLTTLTVTVESSPTNDSLNGGSQVAQEVSQVIVPLVVWICVARELKRLTAVTVPWMIHVPEQLKGS
jgi:hypothetical protein